MMMEIELAKLKEEEAGGGGSVQVFQMEEEEEDEEDEDEIIKWKEEATSPQCNHHNQYQHPQVRQNLHQNHHGNIPKLFFNLYFGCGALCYSLWTFWVLLACCFGSDTFEASGVFYMLAIGGLMWLSTILTFVVTSQFGSDIGTKRTQLRPTLLFGVSLLVKVLMDCFLFYVSIEALRDPDLLHYHEFSQFVAPLMYFGLLYLVTVIGLVVILTTIAVMEDRCGLYATFIKVQEVKEQAEAYLRSKFPPASQV